MVRSLSLRKAPPRAAGAAPRGGAAGAAPAVPAAPASPDADRSRATPTAAIDAFVSSGLSPPSELLGGRAAAAGGSKPPAGRSVRGGAGAADEDLHEDASDAESSDMDEFRVRPARQATVAKYTRRGSRDSAGNARAPQEAASPEGETAPPEPRPACVGREPGAGVAGAVTGAESDAGGRASYGGDHHYEDDAFDHCDDFAAAGAGFCADVCEDGMPAAPEGVRAADAGAASDDGDVIVVSGDEDAPDEKGNAGAARAAADAPSPVPEVALGEDDELPTQPPTQPPTPVSPVAGLAAGGGASPSPADATAPQSDGSGRGVALPSEGLPEGATAAPTTRRRGSGGGSPSAKSGANGGERAAKKRKPTASAEEDQPDTPATLENPPDPKPKKGKKAKTKSKVKAKAKAKRPAAETDASPEEAGAETTKASSALTRSTSTKASESKASAREPAASPGVPRPAKGAAQAAAPTKVAAAAAPVRQRVAKPSAPAARPLVESKSRNSNSAPQLALRRPAARKAGGIPTGGIRGLINSGTFKPRFGLSKNARVKPLHPSAKQL